jgi:nitrate reductase delta subunit
LAKRGSPYEAAFQALLAIAAAKPDDSDVAELLQEPDPDPSDLTALDAAWEDEPVTFGPGESSCKDGIIARIRAARRPASSPNT